MIKDFTWRDTPWRVREMDCRGMPGARGERCLIFESDGVARRVWKYPDGWSDLSIESLVSIMEAQNNLPPVSAPALLSVMSANIERAKGLCKRLRSLVDEQRVLVARRDELFSQSTDLRVELRKTIERYGKSLRKDGTSPAGALELIQTFVGEAIGAEHSQTNDSLSLANDGIAWGVAAYNDAA